jgi:peptidyl-prolyl cis-trans isomerase C
MVPAFETAAFSMPAGSYSETPVQTQFGWHVLKVDDKGIEAAPSLDEMRDQIVANLSRQSFSRIVEELRVGSSLDIRPLEEVMAEARQSAASAQ